MTLADLYEKAAKALAEAEDVALVCHVNPDPDAIGSMLGLAGFLARRGKKVAATWPNDPAERPRWVDALPNVEHLVTPKEMPKQPTVLVTLDAAAANRLDGMIHLLERAATSICIDHHRTNPGFATIDLIDGDASSTCEMVYRLTELMGGGLSADDAACLYAGLITDTGRFQYDAATPETLRVGAALREHGFDHARLAQALYEDSTFGWLKLGGILLQRATLEEDLRLVWTWLTRKDLEDTGIPIQETDDAIDLIRTAREADVAAVFKEQREGGFKVSLRSRGDTNVGKVAESFGGGGHRLAAGYASDADLDATVEALRGALRSPRGD